ncbi:hypothetical protein [Mangrovibacillus cuniculi]|uniref:Uncharacterized protein n=1 Tax=Mangrovibacillus cuniculi TaxID=2593652 RepID=A0A7S8CE10_9BACI|nr:hypothetical protein [Mangrovibacillus cuniculi]QPC48250.1 hypothetical protein G8O30_15650 [Mangrovibacillus cuniculi]
MEEQLHKELAVKLFNDTWDLMDKEERTEEENSRMIHTAHASRYHWGQVGTPLQFARGEWQISRVYALVKHGEAAKYHAKLSLQFCEEFDLGPFDTGFAHEALARAHKLLGETDLSYTHLDMAKGFAELVEKEGDRKWLIDNIETVTSLSIPVWS